MVNFQRPPLNGQTLWRLSKSLGLLFLLLAAFRLDAAEITLTLERNPVALNESFDLVFSATEAPDGDPDFSALHQDFEVLSQGQSSQFSLNNGHASRTIQWTVTVMARHAGQLDIPAIGFGKDHSNPFSVTVLAAGASRQSKPSDSEEVFLEAEASPKNPYVQSEVIYTLRVLSRIIFDGNLGKPEIPNTPVEKLDENQQYTTIRDGVQYQVNERRFAIFPQSSGKLTIPPVTLDAQIALGGRSVFGRFMNQGVRTQRFESPAIELDVRPQAAAFQGANWLPARNLRIQDSWAEEPSKITVGEPVTRTLVLSAEGITAGLLPDLLQTESSNPDIKVYPDQPLQDEKKNREGLISSRQEKVAFIFSRPGTYHLPAIEIPWWNTRTDKAETATLPERTITVLPSQQAATPATAASAEQPEPMSPASEDTTTARPETAPPKVGKEDLWFRLSLLFGLLWLLTLAAWWWNQRNRPAPVNGNREAMDTARQSPLLFKNLQEALEANDPAATRNALSAWIAESSPGSTLDDWAKSQGQELTIEVENLLRALYSPHATAWDGARLRQCLEGMSNKGNTGKRATGEARLENLNRI